MSSDGLDEALKLIGFDARLKIMTDHLDRTSDPKQRIKIEAGIAQLLADHGK